MTQELPQLEVEKLPQQEEDELPQQEVEELPQQEETREEVSTETNRPEDLIVLIDEETQRNAVKSISQEYSTVK